MGNDGSQCPEGHLNSRVGCGTPKPFCRLRQRPNTSGKEPLSPFAVSETLQAWPDCADRAQRTGLAHCCPLGDTPCPALGPLSPEQRQANMPDPPGAPSVSDSSHCQPPTGAGNNSGTQLGTVREGRGSLPSTQSTLAHHGLQGARGGVGVCCWPRRLAPGWTPASLLTCSRSGYTRHTRTQSLSGLQGLWPPWRTWAP